MRMRICMIQGQKVKNPMQAVKIAGKLKKDGL